MLLQGAVECGIMPLVKKWFAGGAKTAIVFPCKGATMVEHIVHIDGVTGSSPVATTTIPGRKTWDTLIR